MSTTIFFSCSNFKIELKDHLKKNEHRIVIKNGTRFFLPKKGGVYTLEGPNGSGKSLTIKLIMGALPEKKTSLTNHQLPSLIIEDKTIQISSISDAYRNGLYASFQNEEFLHNMTIREQFYLRHCPRSIMKNFLAQGVYRFFRFLKGQANKNFLKKAESKIRTVEDQTVIRELIDNHSDPEKVVDQEIQKYSALFGLEDGIFDKTQDQLSGGQHAKLKLINLLLYKNIKILFLDEVMNGIFEEDSFKIIDLLKEEFLKREITAVIVTHKSSEIYRWQPDQRLIIKQNEILPINNFEHNGLFCGINREEKLIPKFDGINNAVNFLSNLQAPYLVLVDLSVINHTSTLNLLRSIRNGGGAIDVVEMELSERNKNLEYYEKVLKKCLKKLPRASGTIVIIGGGVSLNFGGFLASTIHRGVLDIILVPTTVMAISDVAIGSKTSLNLWNDDESPLKHVIGTYFNPSGIILEKEYIKNLSDNILKLGLSEILKHGIVQDEKMYRDCIEQIFSQAPEYESVYSLAVKTQILKANLLLKDPFENNTARLLLFGHLHAHSIERIGNFNFSHGLTVYIGITIDLLLNEQIELFEDLIKIITKSSLREEFRMLKSVVYLKDDFFTRLRAIYNTESKVQHFMEIDKYEIIKLTSRSIFKQKGEIEFKEVTWEKIQAATKQVFESIQTES